MENKTKEIKCRVCGMVELPEHFEGTDGEMSIPVIYCPTLKDAKKYYEDYVGTTYEKNTGNKFKESFKKQTIEPSHESYDEIGFEEAKKHLLEPIEVWQEII